jgi:hypothetical protein
MNASTSGARWDFSSSGLAARTSADRWTGQTVTAGTIRNDPFARRQWDVTGYASSFSASNEGSTVAAEAMAQARFGNSALGAALGLGAGLYAHDGAASLGRIQADAWRSIGVDRFLGEVSAVATRTPESTPTDGIALRPLSYTDLAATWRREYSIVSFGVTAGLRAGMQRLPSADEWASADAAVWMNSRAALVASVGRTLEDAVRGVPRTRYVSVAIRFSAQPHAGAVRLPRRATVGPRITVDAGAGDARRISVFGADSTAMRVELMSDFTDWEPVVLDRAGSAWTTERRLSPGLHRVALRINGGEWIAPANLPKVTDDLGGVVGLITVP